MVYDKGRHSDTQIVLFIQCLGPHESYNDNENNVKTIPILALKSIKFPAGWGPRAPSQNV